MLLIISTARLDESLSAAKYKWLQLSGFTRIGDQIETDSLMFFHLNMKIMQCDSIKQKFNQSLFYLTFF